MEDRLTRRAFLGLTACAGTAAVVGLSGCSPQGSRINQNSLTSGAPQSWDYEADVVIVGGGGTGYFAAASAHKNAASTLILEKAERAGGDSAICGAYIYGYWPEFGQTKEEYLEWWKTGLFESQKVAAGEKLPDEFPLAEKFMDQFPLAAQWSTEEAGIDWEPTEISGYAPGYFAKLQSTVEGYDDVEVLTSTAAYSIMMEDGRASGVLATDEKGRTVSAKARKGVIIATGSFDGSLDMMSKYVSVDAARTGSIGCLTKTGDGHRMAVQAGAALRDMGLGVHYMPVPYGTTELAFADEAWMFQPTPGIMINLDGKRFMKEEHGYSYYGQCIAQQRGRMAYYFITEDMFDESMVNDTAKFTICKAETLQDFARAIGVSEDVFVSEIEKYNSFVDSGKDEDFGRSMADSRKFETGPFYGFPIQGLTYATYGGISTDVDTHVLDSSGNLIEGLYAAGVCTGCTAEQEGLYYIGGLSQAMAFGWLAGQLAATENEG